MEHQHMTTLLEAYKRGYEIRYKDKNNAPELKMHYFKVKEDLPRVQVVSSFLQGIVPAGQCQSLLDVGSGRGVFLFPLLREFPELEVTSLDILPHRVELLQCLHDGGISNLHPLQEDICKWDAPDKSFDVVTMLEVMEHIPDTEAVVRNAVRLAKNYVIVSVPSKPDDNPEHIHLFTNEDLKELFLKNGCSKVKFMSVTNHRMFTKNSLFGSISHRIEIFDCIAEFKTWIADSNHAALMLEKRLLDALNRNIDGDELPR